MLLMKEFMKYTVEMASGGMKYTQSFTMISLGIQVILRLSFQNMRGCSVGITDNIPTKFHDD
jgi:hypothetical protein